jgi:hypothetical protein
MAMEFTIEPHRGIGPVSFGMNRAEVASAMRAVGGGPSLPKGETTDCYFDGCFQIAFDTEGRVDFIEVWNDTRIVFSFGGRDVFDLSGNELVAMLSELDSPDPELTHADHEHVFPQLILTLWDLDTQYDRKGSEQRRVFGTVGVGTARYLAEIRRIHSK